MDLCVYSLRLRDPTGVLCPPLWPLTQEGTCLQWIWMRVTEMVRGTEQLSCERQAETVGVVQPRDWRHLRAAFEYLKGTCKKGGEGLLQGQEVIGQGALNLGGQVWMDIWKWFFTVRILRHWSRLLREAVMPHSWKYLSLGWLRLGVTRSSGRYPCSWQRVWS